MKKINLLYIGNKLSQHGLNKTTIETLGESLKEEGYEVVSVSSKKNFFFRLFDMIFVLLCNSNKTDYVLIDTYSTKAFWYALITSQLSRILNLKYIPILHGGNLPNRLQNNPVLCRLLFENAWKNVAPSNYLKTIFEAKGFTNTIHIPNTISIENYEFEERKIFQLKLLWVRAFATIYNPVMAVEVLFELQKKYPNASLTMVGPDKDGSLQEVQQKANDLGVFVHFTGQLSKEAWWELAKEHDIFINTTHFDNTPVSILEAMALGLAIVSTNVGGLPFLLTHHENALLVNDGDVLAMYQELENIVTHSEEAYLRTKAARKFVETMGWNRVKEQWNLILG